MSSGLTEMETEQLELVVFTIDEVMCALRIDEVQEIKRVVQVTRVHHSPHYVAGVINLRGQIVTLIDLRKKLNYCCNEISESSRMVVVRRGDEQIGLLVDSVEDAVIAKADDILKPPSNIKGAEGHYFKGVYTTEDKLVAILDLTAILEKDISDDAPQA